MYEYYNPVQIEKELAYISISGAVVNLLLAIIFIAGSLYVSSYFTQPLAIKVLSWAAFINIFLAGFNMIPFDPMNIPTVFPDVESGRLIYIALKH